jgi:hypothetical protein
MAIFIKLAKDVSLHNGNQLRTIFLEFHSLPAT